MTASSVPLPTLNDAMSPAAEAFRSLRTTIRFQAEEHSQRSLVVTSAGPHEGKSLVSANLATALAQMGLSVSLIDANLRTPSLHAAFGVSQNPGLADYLSGGGLLNFTRTVALQDCVYLPPAQYRITLLSFSLHAPWPTSSPTLLVKAITLSSIRRHPLGRGRHCTGPMRRWRAARCTRE